MKKDDAIAKLQEHEAELKTLGIQRLYMFGSTIRGEAGEDSDVDLFFDYEEGTIGLFGLMDIKDRVSVILGQHADIMTRGSIHSRLRLVIEQSAVAVF